MSMFETDNDLACNYNPHIDTLYNNLYNAVHSLNNSQPFNFFDIPPAPEENLPNIQIMKKCTIIFTSIGDIRQNNYILGEDMKNCISYEQDECSPETLITDRAQHVLDTLITDQYLYYIKRSVIEKTQHFLEVLGLTDAVTFFLMNNGAEKTSFHRDGLLSEVYDNRGICIEGVTPDPSGFLFVFNLKGLEETTLFYKQYSIFDEPALDLKCVPMPSDNVTIPHTLFRANPNQGAVFFSGKNGIGAVHSTPISNPNSQRLVVLIHPYHPQHAKQVQEYSLYV